MFNVFDTACQVTQDMPQLVGIGPGTHDPFLRAT
jgi:hypothetical protein